MFHVAMQEDIRQLPGNIEDHYLKFYLLNLISKLDSGEPDLKNLLQDPSVAIQAVAEVN